MGSGLMVNYLKMEKEANDVSKSYLFNNMSGVA